MKLQRKCIEGINNQSEILNEALLQALHPTTKQLYKVIMNNFMPINLK